MESLRQNNLKNVAVEYTFFACFNSLKTRRLLVIENLTLAWGGEDIHKKAPNFYPIFIPLFECKD